MAGKLVKRALKGACVTVLLLLIVLGIHIYYVTKPKIDATTVALGRIDIKQPIDEAKADAIENWLSQQNGVSHVVLNRQTDIIIFSFYPVKASASTIADKLATTFNIKAARYMPGADEMKSGCPALSHTFSGKAYAFFSQFFKS